MVDCATAWKYWLVPLLQKNLCAEKKGSLVSTQKSGFRRNNWLVQCGGLTAHCTCNCHSLTSFFERTPGLVSGGPPEDERGGRGDHGPGMVNNSKLFPPQTWGPVRIALVVVYFGRAHPTDCKFICVTFESLFYCIGRPRTTLYSDRKDKSVAESAHYKSKVSKCRPWYFFHIFLPHLGNTSYW